MQYPPPPDLHFAGLEDPLLLDDVHLDTAFAAALLARWFPKVQYPSKRITSAFFCRELPSSGLEDIVKAFFYDASSLYHDVHHFVPYRS